MENLIAKLEAATEGSRELDAEIALIIEPGHWSSLFDALNQQCPYYTLSIDAALTLVPEGGLWSVCDMEEGPFAQVIRPIPGGGFVGGLTQGRAATPALALSIAALRARIGE